MPAPSGCRRDDYFDAEAAGPDAAPDCTPGFAGFFVATGVDAAGSDAGPAWTPCFAGFFAATAEAGVAAADAAWAWTGGALARPAAHTATAASATNGLCMMSISM